MSLIARVSKRYQVVIPKEVRKRLGIKEGDSVFLRYLHDGTEKDREKFRKLIERALQNGTVFFIPSIVVIEMVYVLGNGGKPSITTRGDRKSRGNYQSPCSLRGEKLEVR